MTHSPEVRGTRLVIFTDLDGTLLDSRTYSAEPARASLDLLAERGVPLVFCSSKTAAEQRHIRSQLGITASPFIVENGSAMLVPDATSLAPHWTRSSDGNERNLVLGIPALNVRAGITRAAASAGITVTGFSDLSVAEVAQLCGLDEGAAARAMQREYSETLVDVHSPAEWAALDRSLLAEGLRARHGGRFRTVTSAQADKGIAVGIVASLYQEGSGGRLVTAAVGDSSNDELMLKAVERPYVVAVDRPSWLATDFPNLRHIPVDGPRGWAIAIRDIIAGL